MINAQSQRYLFLGGGFLLYLYLTVAVLYSAGSFPGLHGDESSFGQVGQTILTTGWGTYYAPNSYTGPLVHGGLIAFSFEFFEESVLGLRLPGIILNLLAFLLLATLCYAYSGYRAGLIFLISVLSSPLHIYYSRIAWEVTGLQNLLLVSLIWLALETKDKLEPRFISSLVFLFAAWVGCSSHFIFITPLVAFFLASLFLVHFDMPRILPRLILLTVAIVMNVGLYISGLLISKSLWTDYFALFAIMWILVPVLMTFLARNGRLAALARRVLLLVEPRFLNKMLLALVIMNALWFVASGLGLGLVDIQAGAGLHRRMAAYTASIWVYIVGYIVAAVLMVGFLRGAYQLVTDDSIDLVRRWIACIVIFWPLCLLMTGVYKTSARYYISIHIVYLWVLVDIIQHSSSKLKTSMIVAACTGCLISLITWKTILGGTTNDFSDFRIGNRKESSAGFVPKRPLYEYAKEQGICKIEGNHFVARPVALLISFQPFECTSNKELHLDFCKGCKQAFIKEIKNPH